MNKKIEARIKQYGKAVRDYVLGAKSALACAECLHALQYEIKLNIADDTARIDPATINARIDHFEVAVRLHALTEEGLTGVFAALHQLRHEITLMCSTKKKAITTDHRPLTAIIDRGEEKEYLAAVEKEYLAAVEEKEYNSKGEKGNE